MRTYTIPYQYTIIGTATVEANSLEEAARLVEYNAPCPEPEDQLVEDDQIKKVRFSYLSESFEIHQEDLDIMNDLN
jgi:hypothetical protein